MDLKQEFLRVAHENIDRAGLADLLGWLDGTDFYTAPASSRFHGSFEGGLVMHSLNVYTQLLKLNEWYEGNIPRESLAIVSLFHDLCKVGCYKPEMRWRKDANNKWEQYSTYTFKEDFAYGGHGSKSVFLVQSFLRLTPAEASAINCHMGRYDNSTLNDPSEVYRRNKLAWFLHVADEAASYLMENN